MITVNRNPEEEVESMLRRFRRKVNKEGILNAYRRRLEFVKPSEQQRKKHREALKRMKAKREARRAWPRSGH